MEQNLHSEKTQKPNCDKKRENLKGSFIRNILTP